MNWRSRQLRYAGLALTIHVALAGAYAWVSPPLSGPDEFVHFEHARWIARRHLPGQPHDQDRPPAPYAAIHPPLYHLLLGPCTLGMLPEWHLYLHFPEDPRIPRYLGLPAHETIPDSIGVRNRLLLARLLSVVLGAVTLLGLLWAATAQPGWGMRTSLFAALLAATLPEFSLLSASANPEIMGACLGALAFGAAARKRPVLGALLLGLASLARPQAIGLLPGWLLLLPPPRLRRRTVLPLLLATGPLTVWLVRRAGGLVAHFEHARHLSLEGPASVPFGDPASLVLSFVGPASRIHDATSWPLASAVLALFALGAIRGLARVRHDPLARAAAASVAGVAAIVVASAAFGVQPQGRHLLPAIVPLALLAAAGYRDWLESPRAGGWGTAAALAPAALGVAGLLFVQVPRYGPEARASQPPAAGPETSSPSPAAAVALDPPDVRLPPSRPGDTLRTGPAFWMEGGETRYVWIDLPGDQRTLEARSPRPGYFRAELACLPRRPRLTDACIAQVTISSPATRVTRSLRVRTPRPNEWAPLRVPLSDLEPGPLKVTLASPPSGGGTLLWHAPTVVPRAPRPTRRLVLVSIDTLRSDALFPTDGQPSLLPRLARRARTRGRIFTNLYAASNWTLPSHASMLTGRYPSRHAAGVMNIVLPFAEGTYLPRVLARDGLFTVALVDQSPLSAIHGFYPGFALYREASFLPRRLVWYDAQMSQLLPRLREQDFFLLVHTHFVHDYARQDLSGETLPTLPATLATALAANGGNLLPARARLKSARHSRDAAVARLLPALYAERARLLDIWLERFLDALDREFADAPPIVVLTSDHGESFGEDPQHRRWGHGESALEGEIRVPLALFLPHDRRLAAASALLSHVDLAPTLLQLLDLGPEGPGLQDYDGISLLNPEGHARRRVVWSENTFKGLVAAIQPTTKLVMRSMSPAAAEPGSITFLEGRPGAFKPAGPGASEAGPAMRLRDHYRDYLSRCASGLVIEVANDGQRSRAVDLVVRSTSAAAQRQPDGLDLLDVQPAFLESDDVVRWGSDRGVIKARLFVQGGDADWLIIRHPREIAVALDGPPASVPIFLGGRAVAGDSVVIDRRRLSTLPPPPSQVLRPPSSHATVNIWENGSGPDLRETAWAIDVGQAQILRVLGYTE